MDAITIEYRRNPLAVTWFALIWIAMALLWVRPASADIFFWQDENGVIHFSNQDTPPTATLYMREPEPAPASASPTPATGPEVSGEQVQVQAELERTRQKLEKALERVEDLTDKIRDSQQEAAVSAALAQQAAQISVASTVQTAQEPEYVVQDRLVFVTPAHPLLRRHNGRHHGHSRFKRPGIRLHNTPAIQNRFKHPGHFGHVKIIVPGGIRPDQGPVYPVPFRNRIPKAYGIR